MLYRYSNRHAQLKRRKMGTPDMNENKIPLWYSAFILLVQDHDWYHLKRARYWTTTNTTTTKTERLLLESSWQEDSIRVMPHWSHSSLLSCSRLNRSSSDLHQRFQFPLCLIDLAPTSTKIGVVGKSFKYFASLSSHNFTSKQIENKLQIKKHKQY